MLQSLRIKNLALLAEVDLEFEAGFTAVTGETGAGKSILLGALSLLAGERADKTLIRQGEAACEVEAVLYFVDPTRINTVLVDLGLPICEEGVLILKRTLPRERAPRIMINGSLATLSALQKLGECWIDFHGPSEPRRLLKESCQLELLDLFGRSSEALEAYQNEYEHWRKLQVERAALAGEAQLEPDQIAFLQGQLDRLDQLELDEESIETLERDFQRMSSAQELLELSSILADGLTGEDGVTPKVAALLRVARQLEGLDVASKPLADRLMSASIELADLGAEFESLGGALNFDPDQAESLQARMNAWLEARRKYGGDPAAVAAARDELRTRLDSQGDIEGALLRFEGKIAAAEKQVRTQGTVLRAVREKAAKQLAKIAAAGIAQLGFEKADFQVRVTSLPVPGPMGDSGVEFLFSPNVGEGVLPLSRIASSGESARVMLALKTVLADLDGVPVLVFDEVDANVGGEIGRVVGEKMAAIAQGHQVLCITHLPQVAAQGDRHLVVVKDQSTDRAIVTIEAIHEDRQERISELARMLGDRQAKSARAHAAELLGAERIEKR